MTDQDTPAADLPAIEVLRESLRIVLDDQDTAHNSVRDAIFAVSFDESLTSGALDSLADQLLSIIGPASED